MTPTKASTIAATLTFLILGSLALIFLLLELIALNGVSERQGLTALGLSLGCQSLAIPVLATAASRATTFLITRASWNHTLAVVTCVLVTSAIGGVVSFLASVLAIPVAGVR